MRSIFNFCVEFSSFPSTCSVQLISLDMLEADTALPNMHETLANAHWGATMSKNMKWLMRLEQNRQIEKCIKETHLLLLCILRSNFRWLLSPMLAIWVQLNQIPYVVTHDYRKLQKEHPKLEWRGVEFSSQVLTVLFAFQSDNAIIFTFGCFIQVGEERWLVVVDNCDKISVSCDMRAIRPFAERAKP